MTAWWENPYPGGPMVGPAWPRNLYPPDAKPGHTPSSDGPDIIALKRALSRGGRWPWQPFDDSYSNAVAHGRTGGMVGTSGTAGFQRQMKIQPTGWVGVGPGGTANAVRSARVPPGLPHAGEPLLDATAVDLIEKAVAQFSKQDTTVREQALVEARRWIGTKESPAGSNQCWATDWYGMVGPWCAMAATYWFETAAQQLGRDSPSFVRGTYYAYCPYIVNDAIAQRRGLKTTTDPAPGDLVVYDWDFDGIFDHVGIFEDGTSLSWHAIEGNTSTSNQSNGGEVMRRTRSAGQANTVFVRVAEP